MYDFDLIVVGGGPGGYEAALHAAKLGLRTALIEKDFVGGTCLNRGCIPTKALLHASSVYEEAKNGAALGISCEPAIDLSAVYAYKQQVVEKLRGGVEGLLKSAKVAVIKGLGTLTAPHTVAVGETVYTAESILLATGSVPARPPIPGLDLPGVLTSDELLSGVEPFQSIVIIGGGVIGMEFATFFNDLGVDVTVVEGLDRLLPLLDKELGQNLSMIMKKRGVKIFTGAMVKSVTKTENGLSVNFESKGAPASAEAEVVLCAIGRRPYTDGLFGEGVSLEMEGRRIKVNEKFETSMKGVYAIGVDLSIVPSCVYTRPEIASVGMTEQEAKDAEIPVKVGKVTMFSNGRTVIVNGDRGFMKVLAHAETRRILGVQMMGVNVSDMIGELGLAIANGLTPEDLLKAMRPHPTFEEALTDALTDLAAKLG